MAFLNESDYSVQIRSEVKAVIAHDPASQALAEQMAQEEMSAYLRIKGYDVDQIFSATGSARSTIIMMRMIDIVIYHLHASITLRTVPANRSKRYNDALEWLDKVSDGRLKLDLPMVTPAVQEGA